MPSLSGRFAGQSERSSEFGTEVFRFFPCREVATAIDRASFQLRWRSSTLECRHYILIQLGRLRWHPCACKAAFFDPLVEVEAIAVTDIE
jgi:hypothetical protein